MIPSEFIPVDERLPEKFGPYVCRYVFDREDAHSDMPFYQVLTYYYRDSPPHFQHEGPFGMKVTHWAPLPEIPHD